MTFKNTIALWFVSLALLNLGAGNIPLGMIILAAASITFFTGRDLALAAAIAARRLATPRPRRVSSFALFGRMMFRD